MIGKFLIPSMHAVRSCLKSASVLLRGASVTDQDDVPIITCKQVLAAMNKVLLASAA